jgi:hypothetical protein
MSGHIRVWLFVLDLASTRCFLLRVGILLAFYWHVGLQETGDRNQLLSSLTEQIAAADGAHQQLKARRNEALDQRKDAWRALDDLAEQLKAAETEYSKAYDVSG